MKGLDHQLTARDPLDTAGMEESPVDTPRVATVADVASVAGLLDAFNREFDTRLPGRPRSPRGSGGSWPEGT